MTCEKCFINAEIAREIQKIDIIFAVSTCLSDVLLSINP